MPKVAFILFLAFLLVGCCDECCDGCLEPIDFPCEPDTTILIPISENGQSWINSFISDSLEFNYHLGGDVTYKFTSLSYDTMMYNRCDTAWKSLRAAIQFDLTTGDFVDTSIVIRLFKEDLRQTVNAREMLQFDFSSGYQAFIYLDDSTGINRDVRLTRYNYYRTYGREYRDIFLIYNTDYRSSNINQLLFSKAKGLLLILGFAEDYNPIIRK